MMKKLNEKDDVNTILDDIASIVKDVKFFNMGKELKKAGYKYDFQSSMMPMYTIHAGGHTFGLLSKSYVKDADREVGPDSKFALGILESTTFINEGQFSWYTQDTNRQIGSERGNTIDVFMFDNKGNSWYENRYDGYGEFGGMDYYELLARMNGYSEEDLENYKGTFKEMRSIGIDLAFGKLKTKDKGGKVLYPALVSNSKFNWRRHDFTQEPESDPNQGWMESVEVPSFESVHVPTYSEFLNEKNELNERKLMSRTVGIAPEKGYFKLEDRTKAALIEIIDDVFKDDFLREEGWEYGRFFNSGYTGVTFKLFNDPKEYHLIINMGTMGLEDQSVGYAYIQYKADKLAETPKNLRSGRKYGDYKIGQKTMDAAKEMLRKFVESRI